MLSFSYVRLLKLRSICKNFLNDSNVCLSTVAAAVPDEKPAKFRTLENNPVHHDEIHVGKFYTVNPKVKELLFSGGGIPRSLNIQMQTFRETSIMVRKPALEIIGYLKNLNYSFPAVRFVLYGANGVGKTVTLMHVLHYAFVEEYLLLHIPWVSDWTKRPKEVVSSESRPGRFDIPIVATAWLQHFKSQNLQLLKKLDLKTSKTYTWSQREVTEEGKPLLDVLEHGLNRGRHASDCIAVLLKEIKLQSSSGKFKTLVMIDGVNAFYTKANRHYFKRPDKTLINLMEVTPIYAFEKMLKNDWNHAAVITTVDSIPENRDEKVFIPFTPYALLGKKGFEVLDPFIPIHVTNYTDKEIESLLDYYTERRWLQVEEARTEQGRAELKFLSGYNPYELMKLCDSL